MRYRLEILEDRLKKTLEELRNDRQNDRAALISAFEEVLKIDYAPVFQPALNVLNALPNSEPTENALHNLTEAGLRTAPRASEIQLDHAGPLYHQLLETARYDGSFYTSTAAAILLSRIAMPSNLLDWSDPDQVSNLRIVDPACGTGTLLMAVANTVRDRHINAAKENAEPDNLHLKLIQNVLHGYDINEHGIHLAACMLTIGAPEIDYDHMNLETLRHGVESGVTKAGSIEFLDKARLLPMPTYTRSTTRISAQGDSRPQDLQEVKGHFDLVIMNPPFTRNDIRNAQYSPEDKKKVQKREHEIKKHLRAADELAAEAINHTTIMTFFSPLADLMLKKDSRLLAMVMPVTAASGTGNHLGRKFLSERFDVNMIITSHDPKRIYFSENTKIHESLLFASAPGHANTTIFVSLARNPATTLEALELSEAILNDEFSEWGTSIQWPYERMKDGDWSPALFYSGDLALEAYNLRASASLRSLKDMADFTDGRGIRGNFNRCAARQAPDYRALWDHKTKRRTTMSVKPDSYLAAKNGKETQAGNLWKKRSHFLLANRLRYNTCRTSAAYSNIACLGSAWVSVLPNRAVTGHEPEILKAWCVWANSTLGLLNFLMLRQKTLVYGTYSIDGLGRMMFPSPDRSDLSPLLDVYEAIKNRDLLALPNIAEDPVRAELDEVCGKLVGITRDRLGEIRSLIGQEPTVCHKRAYVSSDIEEETMALALDS